jgi:dihydrolipoamide dehydrogenase
MSDLTCDVAIIGAGTAGLAAERSARRQGAKTLLIDDRFAGTTCAAVGCMPSKLLIAAADAAQAVRRAGIFGIEAGEPRVNGAAVMARVQRERDLFVAAAKKSFAELPEGVMIRGRARFADRTTLVLDDGRRISARAIVIATGASSRIPKAFEAVRDRVVTNETIFDLKDLPRSVGVIGAGPIGLELAQALIRLGVDTMVFDEGETFAALADEKVAAAFREILEREMSITLGVELEARADGEGVVLSWAPKAKDAPKNAANAKDGAKGERRFERLLLAAGRPPQLDGLDLEKAGVALDEHGTPEFDHSTLQCDGTSVFIAGDADQDRPVLHEASAEGTIAGRNAATFPEVTRGARSVRFCIMFTDPPVAVIGKTPSSSDGYVVGSASYENQGRAKIFARAAGLAHLYADPEDGRLLGATMTGPGIEHSAHLIAWAIQRGLTASEVLDLPFYHPTYEEGLMPALRAICKEVHAAESPDRDGGVLPGS